MIRIHNSLTGEKQELEPVEPGHVRMYSCGITVYDYFHVGNARMLVQGSEMLHVQFTALGLILGAHCLGRAREGASPWAWGAAAGACATVATFSFGPGVVLFPALLAAAVPSSMPIPSRQT